MVRLFVSWRLCTRRSDTLNALRRLADLCALLEAKNKVPIFGFGSENEQVSNKEVGAKIHSNLQHPPNHYEMKILFEARANKYRRRNPALPSN